DSVTPASWTGYTVFWTVTYSYDSLSRKIMESVSASGTTYSVTQYSYDDFSRLDCTAVRMNPATFASLPASACTFETTIGSYGPDRITRNTYDELNRLVQVTRAYGSSLEQTTATYVYSANGNRAQVTDANHNVSQMTYDGHDRLAKVTFPSKTQPWQINLSD